MKYKHLTHEQHVELAKRVRVMDAELHRMYMDVVQPAFGKSHRTSRMLLKMLQQMVYVKGSLDTEYHKTTTNTQFDDCGHVYYNAPPIEEEEWGT